MILDNYSSEDLLHEVYRDWKEELEPIIKKKRKEIKLRDKNWIHIEGDHLSKRGNKWWYSNGMGGDIKKPKSWNHMHILARGEKNRWIILRGIRTAREKGSGHGYLVIVRPHVIQRIKERAGMMEASNNQILHSIFQYREVGIYYEYQWKTSDPSPAFPITLPESEALWWNKKNEIATIQVIMRTSLGLFLGLVSKDRGVIELVTYITDLTEEQEELVRNFITPVWQYYNGDTSVMQSLQEYMKGKEDRKVYLLGD